MKNIYKHLNEMEIDLEDFEEMEVSEIEKAKVKKELMNKIQTPKQNKWKKWVTAVSVVLGLMTSALFGLSFSANAEEIPILGNIFKYFNNNGLYEDYKENANFINEEVESNGIKVTVDDAVYDGEKLIVMYTIETDKFLGDTLHINSIPLIENEGTGNNEIFRIADNEYLGKATTLTEEEHTKINVDWRFNSILSDLTSGERIEGDWKFNFQLNKANIAVQKINQSKEKDGVSIIIESLTITPTSFEIDYNQDISIEVIKEWGLVDVDIEVKDNLGNSYVSKYHRGTGIQEKQQWNKAFETLDPDASKLIITPIVRLSDYDGIEYGEDGSIQGKYRLINSKADMKESKMDEIIVEIDK